MLFPLILTIAFLGSTAAIIYLHRMKSDRQYKVQISSHLLVKKIIEKKQPIYNRLKKNWLLLVLQILALALLFLALGNPEWLGLSRPGYRVIILDSSASMQTREGNSIRFDLAKQKVQSELSGFFTSEKTMLIDAGPLPTVVCPFTGNRDALQDSLKSLICGGRIANLDAALVLAVNYIQLAMSTEKQFDRVAEIIVLTDWGANADLDIKKTPNWINVEVQRIGKADGNLAITDFELFRPYLVPDAPTKAFITITNFNRHAAAFRLALHADQQEIWSRNLTLENNSGMTATIDSLSHDAEVLTASIVPQSDDALTLDNRAYAFQIPFEEKIKIGIADRSWQDHPLIRQLIEYELCEIRICRNDFDYAQCALAIIDGENITREIPCNRLMLFSPNRQNTWPRNKEVIVDRLKDHLLLRNTIGLHRVPFSGAQSLNLPSGATTLLVGNDVTGSPIPLSWTQVTPPGYKIVTLGLPIEPDVMTSSDQAPFSAFLINILEWLAQPRNSLSLKADDRSVIPHYWNFNDVYTRDQRYITNVDFSKLLPGLYRSANGDEYKVVVNLCNSDESHIMARKESLARQSVQSKINHSSWGKFLWGAIILIALEWLAYSYFTKKYMPREEKPNNESYS